MTRRLHSILPIFFVLTLLMSANSIADDRVISPSTGFQPANSYSISDIEAINNSTGSLSLHIPITQLPPGPAGFTAGLTLFYNNRYWETEPDESTSPTTYALREAFTGGWHLKMTATLEVEYIQSKPNDPCGTSGLFQLKLANPDGSRNTFMLSNPVRPMPATCEAGTYIMSQLDYLNAPSTWFTADGSFLRLQIDAPSTTGIWPFNSSWTVYRQDGTSIRYNVQTDLTYLKDRNGNQITISKGIDTQNPSHTWEIMSDEFGRSIQLDHYADRDEVTQLGHNAQPRVWKVYYGSAGAITPATYICSNGTIVYCNFDNVPAMATQLDLPNGLSYYFGYTPTVSTSSNYRELRTVTLPTGAIIEYGYRLDTEANPTSYFHVLANTLKSKKVSVDSTVIETRYYDYQVDATTGEYSHSEHTAPDGGVTGYDFNAISYRYEVSPVAGIITKVTNPDGSILQREWDYNAPYEKPASLSTPNPWIKRELATTANSSGTPTSTSIAVYAVDKNGNTTLVEERGWVAYSTTPPPSSSAPLMRKTLRTYMNGATDSSNTALDNNAYSAASLTSASTARNIMLSSELQDSSGAVKSRSQFSYTETWPVSRTVGNLMAEYHWDSTKAASISPGTTLNSSNSVVRTYGYTTRGNLRKEVDARNIKTTYDYGNITGCPPNNNTRTDLYATGEHRGQDGTAFLLDYTYAYNCYSGKRTSATDPNGLVTSISYDNHARPLVTNSGNVQQTTITYNDAARWVATQTDVEQFQDQRKVTIQHYDKLGRVRLSRLLETKPADINAAAADESLGIKTETRYVVGADRKEVWVSNPYRNSEATAPTRGWSVKRFDVAGRTCVEEHFSGAADPTVAAGCTPSQGTTGAAVYAYDAAVYYTKQTVTDAAGKTREMYQDVLGRLIAVREDPAGAKYDTYYEYDFLGNLATSRQAGSCSSANPVTAPCSGGQVRSFTHDSLKRLSTATNPELGGNSVSYWYDNNGNLTTKMSSGSPSLTINYTYDSLNRVLTKDYSDGTTPPATYCYDGKTWSGSYGVCSGSPTAPLKQRLTEVGTTVSRTAYYYDAVGQIASTQTTAGKSFTFTYAYNASSALASETYPDGRVVTTVYDDAGRPQYIKGQMGSTVTYYAGNPTNPIQYTSHGAKSSIVMGNGMTETRDYNSRLQMTKIQAGSLLTILNCYHESDDPQGECDSLPVAGNNGSVQRQKIMRGGQSWVQTYTYDSVNRLSSTTEEGVWSQSYAYDAFGNRWVSSSSGVTVSALTPTNENWYERDVNNTPTNRLAGTNNYDPRGNLTVHGSHTLTYDGEDRLVAASGATPSAKYEYDGEGRRVLAHSCSGTTTCTPGPNANTTIFVYDAFGRLAMEYRAEAATAGTSYYTRDHLGSTRLETNASGQQVKCSDFLPFGEEIAAGTGGRPSCFNANDNKVKFTGKERDAETGLDYFLARYYSGAQGRFTSPDTPLLPRIDTPQM
ncbi:MAG: RHS repeat-associated core domain-containing protein, partial [Acidobacteriota bacterium]|nr:RHS repeat-associated core domain-containing protein [Acidobacteriota bacterium]